MKEKPFSAYQVVTNAIMIIWTIIIILPFLLLFMSSITQEQVLVSNGYSFFPKEFSLDAYKYIIRSGGTILRSYGVCFDGVSAVNKKSSRKKSNDVFRIFHHAV